MLESGDLDGFAALMHEHWENKRTRSPGMANAHIDHLYEVARQAGALGGKLVGAGGGGFLLVYSSHPEDTRQALAEENAQELTFDFDCSGAYATENN
jgi:D-glycero-alpha-D-manno-heptose-7-phosphate kinase